MNEERYRKQIVRFTKHQAQLLDRLLKKQAKWDSMNALILEAVREFARQYAGSQRDGNHE